MAGESRQELVAWINELLSLGYTKVEQCGTGVAYCQIFDSIYGDVVMSKVKPTAKQEYEYIENFKQLQTTFKRHKIDKPIPVERLVKCKMQDNLEFLQWAKKYWEMHYPGTPYDAVGRRKGLPGGPVDVNHSAPRSTSSSLGRSTGGTAAGVVGAAGGSRMAAKRGPGLRPGGGSGAGVSNQAMEHLTSQIGELRVSVDGLEKERDFYFNKLRDIEVLIGTRLEATEDPPTEAEVEALKQVQQILYMTEEGFEVPEAEAALPEEEETF